MMLYNQVVCWNIGKGLVIMTVFYLLHLGI